MVLLDIDIYTQNTSGDPGRGAVHGSTANLKRAKRRAPPKPSGRPGSRRIVRIQRGQCTPWSAERREQSVINISPEPCAATRASHWTAALQSADPPRCPPEWRDDHLPVVQPAAGSRIAHNMLLGRRILLGLLISARWKQNSADCAAAASPAPVRQPVGA